MSKQQRKPLMPILPSAGFMGLVAQTEQDAKFLKEFSTPDDMQQYNNFLMDEKFREELGGQSPFEVTGDRRAKYNQKTKPLTFSNEDAPETKTAKWMFNRLVAGKGNVETGSFAQRTFGQSMTGGWSKMLGLDKTLGADDSLADFSFQNDGVYMDGHKLNLDPLMGKMLSDFSGRILDQDRKKSFAEKAAESTVSIMWDLPLMTAVGALASGFGTAAVAGARATRGFGALVGNVARNSAMFNIMGIPAYVDAINTDQRYDVLGNLFLHNTALGAGAAISGKLGSMASNKAFSSIALTKEIMKKNPAFMDTIGALPGSFGFGYGSSKLAGADDQDALATGLAFAALHFTDVNAYKRIIQQQKQKEVKVYATNFDAKDNPITFGHDYFVEENGKLFKINNEKFNDGEIVKSSDGVDITDTMREGLFYYNEIPNHTRLTYGKALAQVRVQKLGEQIFDKWAQELPQKYVEENGHKLKMLSEVTAASVAVGDLSKLMNKVTLPEDKDLQNAMVHITEKFSIPYKDVKKHVLNNIGEFFADPEAFKAKYVNESKPMQEMAKVVEKAHDAVIKEEVNKEAKDEIEQMVLSADPRSRLIVNKVVSIVEGAMGRGHEIDTRIITSKVDEVKDVAEKRRLENLYMKALEHNRQLKAPAPVEEIKPVEEPIPAEPETELRLETKDGSIPITPTEDGGITIGDKVTLDKEQTDKLKTEGKIVSKIAKVNAEVTWEADGKQHKGVILSVHREAGKVVGYVVKDNETGKNVGLGRTMVTVVKKEVIKPELPKVTTTEKVNEVKPADTVADLEKQLAERTALEDKTLRDYRANPSDANERKLEEVFPTENNDGLKNSTLMLAGYDKLGYLPQSKEVIELKAKLKEAKAKVTNEPTPIEKPTTEVPLKSTNVPLADQTIEGKPKVEPNQTVAASGQIPTSEAIISAKPKEVFDIVKTTEVTRGKTEYKSAKDKFDAIAEELVGKIPGISDAKKRIFKNDVQQLLLNAAGVTDPDGIVTGAKASGVLKRYDEVNKIDGNYNQKSVDALRSAGILDYIEKVKAEQGTATVAEGATQAEQVQAMGGERKFTTQLEQQGFHIENPAVEKATTKSSPERTSLENRFVENKLDITNTEDVNTAYKDKLITAVEKNRLLNEIAGLKVGEKKIDVPVVVSNYLTKGETYESAIDKAVKDNAITQEQADAYKQMVGKYDLAKLFNTTNFADQPVDKAKVTADFESRFGKDVALEFDAPINQEGVVEGKVRTAETAVSKEGKVSVKFSTLTGKDATIEELIHSSVLLTKDKGVDKLLTDLGSDGNFGSKEWADAQEELFKRVAEFKQGYRPDEYGMLSKVKEVWEKLKNFFTGHGYYSSAEIYRKLLDGNMTFGEIARGMNADREASLFNGSDRDTKIRFYAKSLNKILDGQNYKINEQFWNTIKNTGVKDTEINYLKSFLEDGATLKGSELKSKVAEKLFPMQINVITEKVGIKDYYESEGRAGFRSRENGEEYFTNEDGELQWSGEDRGEPVRDITKLPQDVQDWYAELLNGASTIKEEFMPTQKYERMVTSGGSGAQATNYRELSFDMPRTTIDQIHDYWGNRHQSVGWARVEDEIVNGEKTGYLNVNEIQHQLQYTNMPKRYEDLRIGDEFKMMGKKYRVNSFENNGNTVSLDFYENGKWERVDSEKIGSDYYKDKQEMGNKPEYLQSLKPIFHELQIKSLIQYAADRGYKGIRFPTMKSISKIEGFDNFPEEITRLQHLVDQNKAMVEWYNKADYAQLEEAYKQLSPDIFHEKASSKLVLDAFKSDRLAYAKGELTSNEQLLADITTGDTAKAINAVKGFYEESVGMAGRKLRKDNWNKAVDVYGNEWFETKVTPEDTKPISLYNTADMPPTMTAREFFNKKDKTPEQEELANRILNTKVNEFSPAVEPSRIASLAKSAEPIRKSLDHALGVTTKWTWDLSQPLQLFNKLSQERGGVTADFLGKLQRTFNGVNARAMRMSKYQNDALNGILTKVNKVFSPEEKNDLKVLAQYLSEGHEGLPERNMISDWIKNMEDTGGNRIKWNDNHGKVFTTELNKVSDRVWGTLKDLEVNEATKQATAIETFKEQMFKDWHGTIRRLLQLRPDEYSLMGVDESTASQLRGAKYRTMVNPYVIANEVIKKMPDALQNYFGKEIMEFDQLKKLTNKTAMQKAYAMNTIDGKEVNERKFNSDRKKVIQQIKEYQNNLKLNADEKTLRMLLDRSINMDIDVAETKTAEFEKANDFKLGEMSYDDLFNNVATKEVLPNQTDYKYSNYIDYMAKEDGKYHFTKSYIPSTLANEKIVLRLQKEVTGEDGLTKSMNTIFREHHTSQIEAQKAIDEIMANEDGFLNMLKRRGNLSEAEATALKGNLKFDTYNISTETDYLNDLGRNLGYYDFQRIVNQIGANKDSKEIEMINNELQRMMLDRRWEERKGVAGGSQEIEDVFQSLKDLNSELNRRNANKYLQLDLSDLNKEYGTQVDTDVRDYAQSWVREKLRTTKAENSLLAAARNITYANIMFNPRQWFTNATGLLSTGLPVLARYHHARALPELFNNFQQGMRLLKAYKMNEAGKGDMVNLQGEDVPLYEVFARMAKSGFINPVLTEEQLTGETKIQRELYKNTQKVMGFGNIQIEEVNRTTALLSGYKIGLREAELLANEGKISPDEVYDYAFNKAQLINAEINIVPDLNTPLALQKSRGVLRTLLKNQYMLKSFTHNYMHLYSQALKYGVVEGIKGSDKFDKGQLWSFAFANLPMLMLAGVGGLPFSTDMQNIVRSVFKKDTEAEMRKFMATLPGLLGSPEFGDLMMNGMPTTFGVDISKSTGMGDVLAQTGLGEAVDMLTGLNSFKSQQSILGGLKAGVDIPASTASTLFKMMQGDWKAIAETPPLQSISMIRNLTNAVKQSQLGVQTNRGETLVKPDQLSSYNIGMQALGFNSVKATNAKEAKTAMDMISGDRSSAVRAFGEKMQDALSDSYKGDSSTKMELIKAIKEWNNDNAEYGKPIMVRNIILSAINKIKNDKKALKEKGGSGYMKYLMSLYNVN